MESIAATRTQLPGARRPQLPCTFRRGLTPARAAPGGGPVELPGGAVWWQPQPAADSAGADPTSTVNGAVKLPGGALWWQHLRSSSTPLYGTNFVLQRPTVGGQGLVKAVKQPKPVRQPPPQASALPAVWSAPDAAGGLVLAGSSVGSCSVVIDTEFEVLEPEQAAEESAGAAVPAIQPNTSCVGLVWMGSEEQAEGAKGDEASASLRRRRRSKHARRTQMLRYTCNLCGEKNDAEVNPHAWRHGSVFARCQGCSAVHKLRDNLNIFHELAGPVFPPAELRSTYLVQEILDKIQQRNHNKNSGDGTTNYNTN